MNAKRPGTNVRPSPHDNFVVITSRSLDVLPAGLKVSSIVRSRVLSLMQAVCLLLVCTLVVLSQTAKGQVRASRDQSSRPHAAAPAAALADTPIMTALQLNLCVHGSTAYPCPPMITSDDTYIPALTLTYGQILDGVVDFNPVNLNSGTITIYKDADAVCTLQVVNRGSCPPDSTIFDVGNYTLSATLTFPPGSPYGNSSTSTGPCALVMTACNVSISITKDTSALALKSSASPAALGTAVTFTAVATGGFPATPTGDVVFSVDGTQASAVPLDAAGTATFTTSTLALGTHSIGASYAGGTNFLPAANVSIPQVIVPPTTMTTIASSLNPSNVGDGVTFTASVATAAGFNGTPTGAVTFKDGTASFGTVVVAPKGGQNIAQTTISTLAAGTHSITANYSGDALTSASVSPVLVQQVNYPLNMPPAGYTIVVTPSPVSLIVGATAELTVTVTPTGGFAGSVGLSCSDLPNESACTFADPIIPGGGGSTTLSLSTMAPHDCGSNVPYGGFSALAAPKLFRYGGPALAGALLLLLPFRRRFRNGTRGLLALAAVCLLGGLSGCGSHCTDFGTYPGGYTFKVNGAAPDATPGAPGAEPGAGNTATPKVSTSVALSVKL